MEKIEKQAKFSWRDIVAWISYVGLQVMIPMIIMIIMFMYMFQTQGSNLDINIEFEELSGMFTAIMWGMVFSNVAMLIIIFWLFKDYLKDQWRSFLSHWKINSLYISIAYIFTVVFEYIFSTYMYQEIPANQESIIRMFQSASKLQLIILSLTVSFCAPIVEEVLFRKILFGNGKHLRFINVILFIISSLVFGFAHYGFDGNFISLLPYIVMGACMCLVYWKTDNIFTAIMLHLINNSVASILMIIALLSGNL